LSVARRLDRAGARLGLVTRGVDRAYRAFDRARSKAVLRWAGTAVLAEFNALAYQSDATYAPGTAHFRRHLFPWETATIRAHFPQPPARLLIGGAGGGREALALADRGYEIVAFEPAAELAAGMAEHAPATAAVQAYVAGYEDLPRLAPARPGDPAVDLRDLGTFDAGLMGWGSFSHLRDHETRVHALRAMADAVDGPLLVSFLAFRPDGGGAQPGPRGELRADVFSVFIGYYHVGTTTELEQLARDADLSIVALDTDESESSWPHAVLQRKAR
jgi:hypothetical protein